jgi:hypothetical protein
VIWIYLTATRQGMARYSKQKIINKSSKQINSKTLFNRSILFMCSEVWHESAEISEDSVDVL